jgi:hypothetical protein
MVGAALVLLVLLVVLVRIFLVIVAVLVPTLARLVSLDFLLILLCHSLPHPRAILHAARASRQPLDESNRETASDRGDRVRDVALRPDWGCHAAGSLRVAQVPRAVGG